MPAAAEKPEWKQNNADIYDILQNLNVSITLFGKLTSVINTTDLWHKRK